MAKKAKKHVSTSGQYTAEQILQMVSTQRESAVYQDWVTQMKEHYSLFALDPYKPEKQGYQAYTSPRPRNDFLKVYHGINKATLIWKVALPETASEEERKAASKVEDLIAGVIAQADRELRDNGESSLREGLGAFAGLRGAGGLVCRLYPGEDKDTQVDIRPLDPLHLRFERGVKGLVWGAYEYKVSAAEARERWNVELAGPDQGRDGADVTATVVDFYDRKINAVVLAEGTAKEERVATSRFVKPPTPHGLDHVPMFIGFSSGLPTFFDENFKPDLKQKAASVYAASAKVYPAWNKQMSFIMDVSERSVAGTLKYEGPPDSLDLKESPWRAWGIVQIPPGTVLEELVPPKVPEASLAILGALSKDIQESTMAYPVAYGQDPQGHSGTALQVMTDNMKSIYSPFTRLMEDAFRWLCQEILVQFKEKGQKMTLRGFNSAGKFFQMEADPADVNDEAYIQVTCEPQFPRDEQGMLQMGLMASRPGPDGESLISRQTAREKYLMLQDPDAEAKRIQDEKVQRLIDSHPSIQMRRIAQALLDQGDRRGAVEFLASVPSPMAGQGPQAAPPGVPPGAPPGPGMPPGGPEMMGGPPGMPPGPPPPEVVAAAMAEASRLVGTGQPIPPELAMILQMAQGGPAA